MNKYKNVNYLLQQCLSYLGQPTNNTDDEIRSYIAAIMNLIDKQNTKKINHAKTMKHYAEIAKAKNEEWLKQLKENMEKLKDSNN